MKIVIINVPLFKMFDRDKHCPPANKKNSLGYIEPWSISRIYLQYISTYYTMVVHTKVSYPEAINDWFEA